MNLQVGICWASSRELGNSLNSIPDLRSSHLALDSCKNRGEHGVLSGSHQNAQQPFCLSAICEPKVVQHSY